jgi:uncharacterized membrane protein YkoI
MFKTFFRTKLPIAATMLAVASAAAPLFAQGPTPHYKRDLPAALMKQAAVSEADAAKTALAKIPQGRIQAVELENEGGRLIYSYAIKVPNKSGIEEVNVNAKTGNVVNTEHENSASEAREAAQEKGSHKG